MEVRNATWHFYWMMAVYLLANVAIGIWSGRRAKLRADDYFLAGRGVGPVVLFFTFVATNFSAFFFLGFAGAGYRIGYPFYAMMAFGTALAALSFFVIGDPAWRLGQRHGYVTPPEMIGDLTGSGLLESLYVAVMVFFTMPYLALQPIGAGYLIESLSGGQIPYLVGAAALTLLIVAYVWMGGMRSVALTDMLQGLLMFGLMLVAVYVVTTKLGGSRAAHEAALTMKPELFTRAGGGAYFTPQKWFSAMILWTLCVPMFPQMFMRFFISRDLRSLKRSAVLYAFVPCFLFICPVMIGVLGHLKFPGLDVQQSDRILPMMLTELAPGWLASLIMVGAVAAFMSTLDSQLLAMSSILTRDVYLRWVNPSATVQRQVIVGRVCVVLMALVGLVLAIRPPDAIFELVKYAFSGYAVLFPVTVAAIYWPRRVPAWGSCVAIVLGETMVMADYLRVIPMQLTLGMDVVVWMTAVVTLTLVLAAVVSGGRRAPA